MKLISLELKNYKAHKHFVAEFNRENKLIQGNKGSGKTSIKDALYWLLTGTMVDDPTPVDENGVIIENLTISSKGVFDDGTILEITSKRTYKKDGSLASRHTMNYFVNETPMLQKDYQSFLDGKIGTIEQRKILLDPNFFAIGDGLRVTGATNKTAIDRRREIVIGVAGADDLENKIAANDEKMKRAKFAISNIKKEQNDAYAGVETLKDSMIDTSNLNKDSIQQSLEELEQEKLVAVKSLEQLSNADETRNALQRALSDLQTQLSQERSNYSLKYNELLDAARKPYNEYVAKKQSLQSKLEQAKFTKRQQDERYNDLINRETRLNNEIKELLDLYAQESNTKYVPGSLTCQTCLQPLPSDMLVSAEARFNKHKSDRLEQLKQSGYNKREELNKVTKELSIPTQIVDITSIEKELLELVEPTIEDIPTFETTDTYINLSKEIAIARENLENQSNDSAKEIYERTINDIQQRINSLKQSLIPFDTNIHLEKQLEKKGLELQDIANRLDEQTNIVDECNEFTKEALNELEESIKEKFPGIRFKMFEYNLDGDQKDTCITYGLTSNGYIPWENLSGGQKRSATIKLANAFSKAWGVSLPLFIDDTQIYIDDELDATMQLIRITEVPNARLEIK